MHYTEPRRNRSFWAAKIEGNMQRDVDTNQQLQAADWEVLRFWEHEDVDDVVDRIVETVSSRRRSLHDEA